MKNTILAGILGLGLVGGAFADGTTDLLIDPAAGVTISAPGSYVLVADVTMTVAVDALRVAASNVTLDLNGHTITGAPGNSTQGINVSGTPTDVVIENGGFVDFGGAGISFLGSSRTTVRNVRLNNCGDTGAVALYLGDDSRIENCSVTNTTPVSGAIAWAIAVGSNSIASGNIVSTVTCTAGTALAINGGSACKIANNVIANVNGTGSAQGINTASSSVVTGNVINSVVSSGAAATGIITGLGCQILDNRVNSVNSNGTGSAIGISGNFNMQIRGNEVTATFASGSGAASGIQATSASRIEGNVVSGTQVAGAGAVANASGIVVTGAACAIVNNTCNANSGGGPSNSSGVGISASLNSEVRGNTCSSNFGVGTGFGYGIRVTDTGNTIEGNTCTNNTGVSGYGIFCAANDNAALNNRTSGSTTAGIRFNAAGSAGDACRADGNVGTEATLVSPNGTHSLGVNTAY